MQQQIKAALDELLPAMTADGGGAKLVEICDSTVILQFTGSCCICPSRRSSADALRQGIMKRVPQITEVVILYPSVSSTFPQEQSLLSIISR